MAGLGFELRKVYNKGSFLAKQKAYGYAGIIYVGPMILGILLILAVVYLSVLVVLATVNATICWG